MDITNQKILFDFDKDKFNFPDFFLSHLSRHGVTDLQKLHSQLPNKLLANTVVTVANDQAVPVYEVLYNIFEPEYCNVEPSKNIWNVYKDFIYYLSNDIFNEKLVYQRKPTLRVQFPGNKAVGGFHRDRDYNHPPEEKNIWIPLTPSFETNTIWMESAFDKEDYKPVNLNYGQGLIFDSGLKHGNKINDEGLTRLSFDFRVIPKSIWTEERNHNVKSSLKRKLQFKINGYYDVMN